MKRQTRRMKDIAKRGLVGLLTVSMCLSNVQGIAFADNRVEVGGVKVDGKKMTVMDALATKSFGKIYIMLGMNELGWVYAEQFQEEYGKIIDRVREINPQAEIYIQSILPVSQKKDDEGTYVNNQRIHTYNELLIQLAEEKEVAYVNVAEAVTDETGKLPEDATADGVHLQPASCKIWLEYLKTHTIEGMNG